MSNHKKVMKFFFKVAQNPRQFYESLDYHSKRLFQNILFPEGFRFSMKNKECRTSKMNLIFELTSSFLKNYNPKKQKTQTQKVLESHIVAGTGLEPVTFGLWARRATYCSIPRYRTTNIQPFYNFKRKIGNISYCSMLFASKEDKEWSKILMLNCIGLQHTSQSSI